MPQSGVFTTKDGRIDLFVINAKNVFTMHMLSGNVITLNRKIRCQYQSQSQIPGEKIMNDILMSLRFSGSTTSFKYKLTLTFEMRQSCLC